MAQQNEIRLRNARNSLVQCTYCAHIWLARTTAPVLSCSACNNKMVARDNIIANDVNSLSASVSKEKSKVGENSTSPDPDRPNVPKPTSTGDLVDV